MGKKCMRIIKSQVYPTTSHANRVFQFQEAETIQLPLERMEKPMQTMVGVSGLVKMMPRCSWSTLHEKKRRNSNFFYVIDLDNEGKLRSIFWIDGKSRLEYHYFHDVVSLITTILTNKYQMPFCPFIGINNHGHSVLLGASLLSDETKETYTWLFRTWMDCMGRCPPYVFLTDQCMAIRNAVTEVFPRSQHRLCL